MQALPVIPDHLPFFLEHVEAKSLSSVLTCDLLHFILQKKERRAPERSLEGPGVMSVRTGSPAEKTTTHFNAFQMRTILTATQLQIQLIFLNLPKCYSDPGVCR